MSWEYHASPWNIAFSTSPKSHFWMVKRPKMSSKRHATPWNIAFRLHPSGILGWSRGRKWVPKAWRPLETSPSRHHIIEFWTVKTNKVTFKCHSTTLIVAMSTWKSHIFGWWRRRKWRQSEVTLTSFSASYQPKMQLFFKSINRRFKWSNGT